VVIPINIISLLFVKVLFVEFYFLDATLTSLKEIRKTLAEFKEKHKNVTDKTYWFRLFCHSTSLRLRLYRLSIKTPHGVPPQSVLCLAELQ